MVNANGNSVQDEIEMILKCKDKIVRKLYYTTHYKYIECSMKFGKTHYFCNDFSLDDTRNCHDLYHKKYHGKEIDT